MRYFDEIQDEMLARGGTFDISGTNEVTTKKIWGFNAEEGTVLDTLKGVPVGSSSTTEVDLIPLLVTSSATGLFGNCIYRVAGYVITNVKLTSGMLHCFLTAKQD